MSIRFALAVFAVLISCGVAAAQTTVPIRGDVKFGGFYDARTGRRSMQAKATTNSAPTVYNNTCTAQSYLPFGTCIEVFDEGRLPGPGEACSSAASYQPVLYEVGYCTAAIGGAVDLDFALFDTGQLSLCETSMAYAGETPLWRFDSSALGFPLPGSTTSGVLSCWQIAFTWGTSSPCLSSGLPWERFHYSTRNNNTPAQTGNLLGGPMLAGVGGQGVGMGTFCNGYPSCITGLGNDDQLWVNVDGVPVGGTAPPCALTPPGVPPTTGCVSFGGAPFAGLYARLEAWQNGPCVPAVGSYCTAKTTSAGCMPILTCSGGPSASATAGFQLAALGLRPNKFGIFFYSTAGSQITPFQGAWLCMKSPLKRLPVQNTGSSGPACGTDPTTGVMTREFNTYMSTSTDPTLVAGASLRLQAWTRDPPGAFGTSLTGALVTTIAP
ncbi:MAG: hypothetical protein K8S98_11575 [Planctomycetes bacterium]|nr:hypothetical protein [Planctomycetota bacterium]